MKKVFIITAVLIISTMSVSMSSAENVHVLGNRHALKNEKNIDRVSAVSLRKDKSDTVVAEAVEICNVEEPSVPQSYFDVSLESGIQDVIFNECEKFGVEPELVMAVIKTESGCRPDVISATDDYGLMQINKCNHSWLSETLGIDDFLDAEQNIKAGVYMLSNLWHKYDGDANKILMAYNCGEGGANKLWNQGVYETSYSRKVLAQMESLTYR